MWFFVRKSTWLWVKSLGTPIIGWSILKVEIRQSVVPQILNTFTMFKCDPYPAVRLHVHDDHLWKSHSFFSPSNYQWEIFRIQQMEVRKRTIYGRYLQFRFLKWPLKLGNLTQSSHPSLQLAGVCRHRLSPPCRSRTPGTPWRRHGDVKNHGTFPAMVKHGETWWILVDFGGFLLGKTLNH